MNTAPLAEPELDALFAALADGTRRAILARLASGEATVLELTSPFAISQPAISKHLAVLERAGLISRRKDGVRRPCRLEAARLAQLAGWIERYREAWEERYQRLDDVLRDLQRKEKPRATPKARSHRRSR